ncbi:hypothetical protein BOTBODRAFT_32499, partial [Botryobasidium botryosum FD-172 SS1]
MMSSPESFMNILLPSPSTSTSDGYQYSYSLPPSPCVRQGETRNRAYSHPALSPAALRAHASSSVPSDSAYSSITVLGMSSESPSSYSTSTRSAGSVPVLNPPDSYMNSVATPASPAGLSPRLSLSQLMTPPPFPILRIPSHKSRDQLREERRLDMTVRGYQRRRAQEARSMMKSIQRDRCGIAYEEEDEFEEEEEVKNALSLQRSRFSSQGNH